VARILGTVLLEQHEAWMSGRRYLDMEAYFQKFPLDPEIMPEAKERSINNAA